MTFLTLYLSCPLCPEINLGCPICSAQTRIYTIEPFFLVFFSSCLTYSIDFVCDFGFFFAHNFKIIVVTAKENLHLECLFCHCFMLILYLSCPVRLDIIYVICHIYPDNISQLPCLFSHCFEASIKKKLP